MALKQKSELQKEWLELYPKVKFEEYDNCNHVLVCTNEDDLYGFVSHGCVKCGLNDFILEREYQILNFHERIMYEYLLRYKLHGMDSGIACDIHLGMSICSKIKEKRRQTRAKRLSLEKK